MRIWLDPDKVAAHNLTAGEVVAALQAQNVQVSSGVLGQPPVPQPGAFQLNVQTLGRLTDPAQFADIIVKSDNAGPGHPGQRYRPGGAGRAGLRLEPATSTTAGRPCRCSSTSSPAPTRCPRRSTCTTPWPSCPNRSRRGMRYDIVYDTTGFIAQSVHEVLVTILEAVALVVVVVILFLQTWRASVIPIIAIPVSLVGTFAVLAALGFSLNNLSAVRPGAGGRHRGGRRDRGGGERRAQPPSRADSARGGRAPDDGRGGRRAGRHRADAVRGVHPVGVHLGISGQFFRQFAVTIAASTVISCFVSLTLSPALCAILFKPHVHACRPPTAAGPPASVAPSSTASIAPSSGCRTGSGG